MVDNECCGILNFAATSISLHSFNFLWYHISHLSETLSFKHTLLNYYCTIMQECTMTKNGNKYNLYSVLYSLNTTHALNNANNKLFLQIVLKKRDKNIV